MEIPVARDAVLPLIFDLGHPFPMASGVLSALISEVDHLPIQGLALL